MQVIWDWFCHSSAGNMGLVMQVIWDCFCPTMQVIWDCFCPSNAGDTWSCWLQPLRGTLCTSHCLLLVDLMGPSCSGLSGQCLLLTAVAWTLCAICLVPTTFVGGFHCVQYAWYPLLLWVGFRVCVEQKCTSLVGESNLHISIYKRFLNKYTCTTYLYN